MLPLDPAPPTPRFDCPTCGTVYPHHPTGLTADGTLRQIAILLGLDHGADGETIIAEIRHLISQ
jgi:hypothetical protein